VIAHGRLYVRNAEEMACYALGQAPGAECAGGNVVDSLRESTTFP
jgi:hypothetical protein